MKRALGAALLAASLIFVPASTAKAEPAGSITWTVDHDRKTITVSVQLYVYSACSAFEGNEFHPLSRACAGGRGQVTQDLANRIKKQIEAIWNKPYHYRCYRLIIIVNIQIGTDAQHIPGDRIAIRIDPSAVAIRSYVQGHGPSGKWNSNDPADRFDPSNDGSWGGSIWDDTPYAPTTTWAHEFGHILGLDDYYQEGNGQPKPGAPIDLMTASGLTTISQETIDRVVERNQDHLVDKDGARVDLKDLRCDRLFRATLVAGDRHYDASHHMNSAPECPSPATTSSTDQDLTVASEYADLNLVETPEAQGVGYRLTPVFDVLMLENGMAITGRRNVEIGLFDLPVTVDVRRAKDRPASGEVPDVRDSRDKTCAGGGGGTPPPEECGRREYKSWMAMSLTGPDEIWPIASVLPATLRGIGNFGARFELLYRNCAGPTPWPGAFAPDGGGATVTRGKLPSLQKITQVADDWFNKGIPGKIEIDGGATLNEARLGFLQTNRYAWTLTLCPLDRDGNPPPGCP